MNQICYDKLKTQIKLLIAAQLEKCVFVWIVWRKSVHEKLRGFGKIIASYCSICKAPLIKQTNK